jgi:Phage integrase family.
VNYLLVVNWLFNIKTTVKNETTAGDEVKVWLTDDELEELRRAAGSRRDDLVIQLDTFVGLRAFEIPQVRPERFKRTSEDGSHYRLRIPERKDTQHGEGKPRDAYVPADTERDLFQCVHHNDFGDDESYVDLASNSVYAVVRRTADAAADRTGKEDVRDVSSHDLRRRFAQRLLVDEAMNPRVVMAVGRWSSFSPIEPYLNAPSAAVINDAFAEVDV